MKNFKVSSSANGKVFRNGLYSTAILAAAIVLAVLINLLVGAIPKKYTEFDLSAAKMYTLGDSSRQLMQSLDQDVTVYYLCETGSEDAIITKLLDHYADESGHFHWEQKDPALYPTFAAQYGAENASTGSLIVVSGENSEVLNAAELYEYDYSDYYTTGAANVTFGGEKQISSAIYKLTAAAESHAYYTTNHGEQALTSSLTEALKAQNIDAQPLDLLTGTIPEDCDLLIISDPASDFAADGLVDEIAQLQAYLENGGKVLLTTSGYTETPNLDAVMAQFGLAREPGLVVEGDAGHALYGYPYSLFPDYAAADESTALDGVNQSTHVMLSVAQGITITETDDVTAEPLLYTTEDAYSKQDFDASSSSAKEAGDTDGPFSLAVWARNDSTGAEVIWIGCPQHGQRAGVPVHPGQPDLPAGLCRFAGRAEPAHRHQSTGSCTHHGPGFRIHDAGHGVRIRAARSSAHCRCCGGAAAPPQVRGHCHENKTAHPCGASGAGACAGRAAVVCQPQQCRRRGCFQRRRRGQHPAFFFCGGRCDQHPVCLWRRNAYPKLRFRQLDAGG